MPYMEFRIDNTLISNYSPSDGGGSDTFLFQPSKTGAGDPSTGDFVVTKVNDIASVQLSRNGTDMDGFVANGSADPFVDPSNPHLGLSGSVGEIDVATSDGGPLPNPYVTVDYVEYL